MNINDLFEKRCVNRCAARDKKDNRVVFYHRIDLYEWACEAAERDEDFFYCRPVDPNNPYGKLELCEPEYRWFLKNENGLTEDEFRLIEEACNGFLSV